MFDKPVKSAQQGDRVGIFVARFDPIVAGIFYCKLSHGKMAKY